MMALHPVQNNMPIAPSPSPSKRYTVEPIPYGYKFVGIIHDTPWFFNERTKRYYDPITRHYYNNITKGFEEAKPRNLGFGVFDPIIVKGAAPSRAPQIERPVENPDHKKVYMGRSWQKFCHVMNKALKKLAGSLCLVVAAALALATACGGYATFALLIQQGNPVGVIVGFLTLYFGVATYKYTQIALAKLYQENNKPLDCFQKKPQ